VVDLDVFRFWQYSAINLRIRSPRKANFWVYRKTG